MLNNPMTTAVSVSAKILVGDVRSRLQEIEANSVQAVITSPPYWGLRDYGTAIYEGGNPNCPHSISAYADTLRGQDNIRVTAPHRGGDVSKCHLCGATRLDQQIGLEQTPQAYVQEMVQLFQEVRRVLKDDGTLWLNLGDSYSSMRDSKAVPDTLRGDSNGTAVESAANRNPLNLRLAGLKHKDLVGIPWRVALALQEDGWYLRQDIIWHKPNPMPESVKDRCTKSHEYLFLLSKSARYFFDNDAMKEPAVSNVGDAQIRFDGNKYGDSNDPKHATKSGNVWKPTETRNRRSVWSINTKPFKGAHFAVMPEKLVEPCLLAGSKQGDTVLDPFTGSGTVAVVALRHQRNFVGIELNPEYAEIAEKRIIDSSPLFNQVILA